jgi:hypothetical protein
MAGLKIRRTAALRALFVFLITALWIAFAAPGRSASSKHGPPLQKSASFGAYTANTYFDPDSNTRDAYFEILRNKKPVYRGHATENGEKFVIGTLYDDDPDAKLVAMGRDITGDGQPDLLISEWTRGANCCLTLHIFEIGTRFRKIGDIDAEFGDQGPHFVHLDQLPGLQIQIYDWTFANWHSDFADSPAPKVILQYQRGAYRVAPDLMCTGAVDMKGLAAKIEKIRTQTKDLRGGSWPDADLPPELWGTMLDLIYTCHRLQAWLFLDEAWPKQVAGKEGFVNDFSAQLKKSPYWKSVSQLGT